MTTDNQVMNNNPNLQRPAPPKFDRVLVFGEVDKSNKRFQNYSREERRVFAEEARALSVLKQNAQVRRA
jgi:hypothetical protein